MGSSLISSLAAARILGLKLESFNHLVRRGLLQPIYPKGKGLNQPRVFAKTEVAALAEAREHGVNLPRIASMSARAHALAKALEVRVTRLEQVLGVGVTPIDLSEEGVLSLYAEALDTLSPPREPADVLRWTQIMLNMGEEFFELLEAYTGDEDAWKAFLDFSRAALEDLPDTEDQPDLRQAFDMLRTARKNLRHVLFFFLRSRYGTRKANEAFLNTPHSSPESLLQLVDALR